jgi:GT2 family glycosyltransferase
VRERDPSASVYNRLCALEWRKDPGPVPACGGIFMVRAEAFRAVGGFRPEVIAAEDDELCLRLRRLGMGVELLDADMVVHDAAMKRFSQWWQRARRSGHAYAQGAALHGRGPERHMVRDRRRIWFWGLGLPLLALGAAWPTRGLSLALLGAYPLQVARIWRRERAQGWSHGDALLYAAFAVLGKVPGLLGLLEYHWRRWRGSAMTIIEHKQVGEPR